MRYWYTMSILNRLISALRRPRTSGVPALDPTQLRADWIIIGLGNPGTEYAATRHNVGYMAVDDILARDGDLLSPIRGMKAHGAVIEHSGARVLLLRSTTYMNLSGEAVAPLADALGVPVERIICIHDELDLPAHTVRLKLGGNENGHNGLKSLSEQLGTRDYVRVRIGIARPPRGASIPDYVLGPVDAGAGFDEAIALAAEGALAVVEEGLGKAQNRIHAAR